MDIICNDKLAVHHNGTWKKRKAGNFVPSSPWGNPTEWKDIDYLFTDEGREIAHVNDAFILCWIDNHKAQQSKQLQIKNHKFVVKKSATSDDVIDTLNAVVYFSEGAKVESPKLCGYFTSDLCLYYTDIDGTIGISDAPHKLSGQLPETVAATLRHLLGLPPQYKTPFCLITTEVK